MKQITLNLALLVTISAALMLAPGTVSAQIMGQPAFMLDPTCPNALAAETRAYDLGKSASPPPPSDTDANLRYMAGIAPVYVPALTEVVAAFDACAVSYSQPSQVRQAYHARLRASTVRFMIGVLLLSEKKTFEGRVSLEAANFAAAEVVRAPSADVAPDDRESAAFLTQQISPMLAYVVKSGDAFDPRMLFPPPMAQGRH